MPKNSEAIRLAEASDWKGLQRLIEKAPELACESGDYGMLPIHWACTERKVPLTLLDRLLAVHPEGARTKNSAGLLPLHIAIRANVPPLWLEKLLAAYPEAVKVKATNDVSVLQLADQAGLQRDAKQVLYRVMDAMDGESPEHDEDEAQDQEEETLKVRGSGGKLRRKDLMQEWPPAMEQMTRLTATMTPLGSPLRTSLSSLSDGSVVDLLVSPSSTSTSSNALSTSSVNSAPLPMTTPTPLDKQMVGPFQRKHSLEYPKHVAAAAAATRHHQETRQRISNIFNSPHNNNDMDDISASNNSTPNPRGSMGGRHQSLPVIPSFEDIKLMNGRPKNNTVNGRRLYENDPYSDEGDDNNNSNTRQFRMSHPNHLRSPFGQHRRASHPHGHGLHGGRSFESPPEWKRDDECSICHTQFGMFKHRHHCRNCGKSICSQHSADKKIVMESKGFTTPQRVCVTCYAMITHTRAKLLELNGNGGDDDDALARNPVAAFAALQQQQNYYASSLRNNSPFANSPVSSTRSNHGSSGNSVNANNNNGGSNTVNNNNNGELHGIQQQQRGLTKEKMETYMLHAQMNELRGLLAAQQKQIDQLVQVNLHMQHQLLEQEERKAETTLLITQLMTRVSVLELQTDQDPQQDEYKM